MFNYQTMKKQIFSLEKAIQKADNDEDAKNLLELQQTLIALCNAMKSDKSI